MKKRVIAFCRVSTEEQASEDRAGIPRQQDSIARTAKARDLEIVEEIILADVSGSNVRNAPPFQEMLRKVRDREIDGVVVSDLDRLVRPNDLGDLEVLDVFRRAGAAVHTQGATHDFGSVEGTLLSQLTAIMAGHERRLILKRYQEAKEVKRKQGKCPSAKITLPTGVDYDRKAKIWHYTPEVAKIQEAFRLLDEDGVTNLSIIGGKVGIGPRTLFNLLRNPIFTGWRVYDRKRGEEKYSRADGKQADRKKIPRTPEETIRIQVISVPAVDPERFERVQRLLAEKGVKWRSQRTTIETNLGAGLATCGRCGRRLYASSGRRSTGTRPGYYFCAANYYLHRRKGLSCTQPSVRKDHLDKTLVSFVAKYLASEETIAELIRTVSTTVEDNSQSVRSHIADLERKKDRLLELYTDGIMEKGELATHLEEIKKEIQGANRIVSQSAERSRAKKEAMRNLRLLTKACIAFKNISSKEEQKSALRALFASVAFDGQKVVGFVPLLPGMSHVGCTENGSRRGTDSSRPQA